MAKFSGISVNNSPSLSDTGIGVAGGTTDQQSSWANIFKLLADATGTSLSSQLQTFTPTIVTSADLASVTPNVSYFINLGGIKLCWGTINHQWATSGAPNTGHVEFDLPTSFFSSLNTMLYSIQGEGNYAFQVVSGDAGAGGAFGTTAGYYLSNGGSNGGGIVSFFGLGS